MRKSFAAAVILAAAGAAFAGARPSAAADAAKPVSTDVEWLAQPSFTDMTAAFPREALKQGVSGQTVIDCTVEADGRLSGCVLASETPAGMGFGAAALSVADRFRAKPLAAGPHKVSIPMRWRVVSQPHWERLPTGDQMAEYFPPGAASDGEATMRCTVTANGTLADCKVELEAPPRMGFGEASLKVSRYFRLAAGTPGESIAGDTIVIPIRWQIAGQGRTVFRVGEDADLITILEDGAGPPTGERGVFKCPTPADKAQRCQTHGVSWSERPSNADALEVMTRNHVGYGLTKISCKVAEGGALKDCVVIGQAKPGEEAAMRALAGGLRALPESVDGIPVQYGRVVVRFNWEQLMKAAKQARAAAR